ncbi:dTDP-4-dehydrorhamnose reductase [Roseovarius atlanticus]|uniref:dTDP-4-dehydrorhamnose reductase n=1 Tax=Roseovarius atlanticus TaxID=1641875 RepID=UPI001C938CD4|nr:dTDP-4-dehydrorhamnose reductase [Roseovarius atlanticus]MBY5986770.1 dTDP-4-dehydrorhamnose reductase [Roseovarius atlanticus]MBY6125410.1 dTDP-4-dehydrorhamnose reductase [Roseovarius atlanticus]MBY6150129.1 dTDP-4-dehydrorhamnose reductase [Roseovarius atlanticus]
MSTLVFGSSGQVATELRLSAPDAMFLGRDSADLTDPAACAAAIAAHRPDLVINAAAYTAVDRAEEKEALAHIINADAPSAMARAAAELGVPFVHISTDYVFDGTGTRPWAPSDATAPQNAYGRTKLAGEEAVRAAGGVHAILRTSWVVSAHGANFVKTMLRLGAERDALTIVADQVGGPTTARDIATACLRIGDALRHDPALSGTFHFSGAPDVSWADFARAIFDKAGLSCAVTDIPTADYPTPAARPLNSRLDCTRTETVFGLSRPDWRDGLDDILKALKEAQDA